MDDLQSALDIVRWARSKASASLVLPEQIDPYDGQPLSVAPLTWSHAQVVSVVRAYIRAARTLRHTGIESAPRTQTETDAENVDNH